MTGSLTSLSDASDPDGTSPGGTRPGVAPCRRVVLRGAAVVAAAGAAPLLTGCGGEDDGTATDGATTSSGDSTGGGTSATAVTVALSEVPEGEAVSLEVGGRTVIVAQPSAGEFRAYDTRCPHQGCTVGVARGLELACPCHGSNFDATDGSVTQGPATTGLTELEVTVEGNQLVIA